jgi:hypothetical protein
MEKDGTRAKPEYGSMWYAVAGPDREHARPESHITIAVPGATTQSTGLPDNGRGGGAWIMNAGTMKAPSWCRADRRRPGLAVLVGWVWWVWWSGEPGRDLPT